MKYYSKLEPSIIAFHYTDMKSATSFFNMYDPAGAFHRWDIEHLQRGGTTPALYINLEQDYESFVPKNSYIILRTDNLDVSRFYWHSATTFERMYSKTKPK